ncbi:MAG TPA: choice-of-anchor D domain-containing protein [Terriglobales bacterium]|jgi:hypothetical protein
MHKFPRPPLAVRFFVVLMGLCFLPVAVPAFAANMAISPTRINYGNAPVNSGPYYYVTLRNSGTSSVRFSGATITGPFKFAIVGTISSSLSVGQSVLIQLKFVPKTTGNFTGTFSVFASNAPTVSVALSGTATSTTSTGNTLTVSPASFSFGNVTVGSTSAQTATFKAGSSAVTISAASTTNPEFTLTNLTLPKTLAAGQSISVGVNFKPGASGSTSTTFTIANNSTNSSAKFTASGAGVATTQHTVGLTWSPSTSSVVGYNVYRGTTTGGPYSKLNSSAIVTTFYSDSTVKSGSTYYYVTTAMNSSGAESIKSNEVRTAIPTP